MIGEPGECRSRSPSNDVGIVIQKRNEQWNGLPNFLAKLDFILALAMFE
jgi:hypothetical protein